MAGNDNNDMYRSPMRMTSKEAGDFMRDQQSRPTDINREWVCREVITVNGVSRLGTRIYFNPGSNK
jgi:hypothetical protein